MTLRVPLQFSHDSRYISSPHRPQDEACLLIRAKQTLLQEAALFLGAKALSFSYRAVLF